MAENIIRSNTALAGMLTIGFIGLGLMGKPMAKRLLNAGFTLTVHNRSQPPVRELVSLGARAAMTPKDVAKASDVVITMLPDSPDVRKVMLGDGGVVEGIKSGSIAIDCSTASPLVEMEIAEEMKRRGVDMLDAPVSGSTMAAEAGTLTFMVGGSREAFERSTSIFNAMGKHIFYVGKSGMGSFTKLCNQVAVAVNLLAACETLVLASRVGLEPKKTIEVLGTGAAGSWQLTNLGPRMVDKDWAPGFKIEHLRKDLRIIREVCERMGIKLTGVELVNQLLGKAEEQGLGAKGTQSLITVIGQETEGQRHQKN